MDRPSIFPLSQVDTHIERPHGLSHFAQRRILGRSSRGEIAMKRLGLLTALAAVVLFLAIPIAANAGWVGSRYEKSDCTLFVHNDGTKPSLYCETYFIGPQEVFTDVLSVPDATCPSGFRLIQEVQTVEVTYFGYDFYIGPVPVAWFNTGGNEFPVSYRLLSTVDTDLGCAP